jgi:L-ascorbate metabolism protein UlaG (beta-lactamase superfamily)
MQITWYTNASIRLDIDELSLLFDPFVPLPGATSPKATDSKPANPITAADYLPAPHILITHGHLDHLRNVPELAKLGAGEIIATATPHRVLTAKGVASDRLRQVKPGDELQFATTDSHGPVTVTIKRGKHIKFDWPLVLRSLINPRLLRYASNSITMIRDNMVYVENNETVIFEVAFAGKLITVLGSLSLAEDEQYTQHPDLLVLPYQGNSHLPPIALSVIERIAPQAVLLDHFDDAFPPITREIDTTPLIQALSQSYPQIKVIMPVQRATYSI